MRNSAWIIVGMALLLRPGVEHSAQAQDENAKAAAASRNLQAAGLTSSGKYWIVADEEELRRQLAQLPREEKAFYTAQQQFRTLQGQFQNARGQLQRSRTRLTEILDLLGNNSTGGLQRQQLEGESGRLTEQITQAEQVISGRLDVLDESSEMTTATVDLVNAQNALAVRLLNLRRSAATLPQVYRQLAADPKVQTALAARGGESLGPIENYGALPRKLERLEAIVFTDSVPFYRRSGQIRITAILDERLPVTFSYMGVMGATVLPASALVGMRLNLEEAPPGAPVQLEQVSIATRRVIVPTLRIGKFVWEQVPVDVLPPEADYLGARISQQAFAARQARVEDGKLMFVLRAAE